MLNGLGEQYVLQQMGKARDRFRLIKIPRANHDDDMDKRR
ncbi:hypothetical protein HSBAA_31110 [Vreelandella sulfidaeris]|uniref:Uncharacterized protein n=1 Tax=Vreelandella sulfidaeris TaxID=115553 RepID=A0A455U768_9GAMM|nr:hypothetical protein HSBAA_31110 [Halomonas sulfidaeris]